MQAVDENRKKNQDSVVLNALVDGLDPNKSKIDRRIIYELTGLFEEEFYQDESD